MENPFVARGWTGQVELYESTVILSVGNDSVLLLPTNPERLWFLIQVFPFSSAWGIWPSAQGNGRGIRTDGSADSILIHNASYPGLVQSQWYFNRAGGGNEILVIEGRQPSLGVV